MNEQEFKERLEAALKAEFTSRREWVNSDYAEKAGSMYAKLGSDMMVYDLNIPEIRAIILEYYGE